MKTVIFSKSRFLGLCAYINQAELSLDRIGLDVPHELPDFYENHVRHPVESVVKMLRGLTKDYDTRHLINWARYEKESASIVSMMADRISSFLIWNLAKHIRLPIIDVVHVVDALERFADILAAPESFPQTERMAIRLHLATAESILERRLPNRSLVERVRAVSHLNQSEFLHLKEVEEIAGDDWLKPEKT